MRPNNNCIFLGRITKDIELRYTAETQMAVASFTLALNNGKDKDGNERKADFPKIIAYGKTAETLEKFVGKGQRIAVQCHVHTGSYEKDGKTYYTTDFIVDAFDFIDFKNQESVPDVPEQEFIPMDDDIPF